jgi:hypothetical protein
VRQTTVGKPENIPWLRVDSVAASLLFQAESMNRWRGGAALVVDQIWRQPRTLQ